MSPDLDAEPGRLKLIGGREKAVRRRSIKGAIHVGSAEGRGITHPDARVLAREAARRALQVVGRGCDGG